MTRGPTASERTATRPPGFALVEAMVAVLLVAGLFAASLAAVGASRGGMRTVADRSRATLLAEQLLNEAAARPYWDGYGTGPGPESDETAAGDRSPYDDVDDYDGWSASPPQRKNGTVIDGFNGWRRTVEVRWTDPTDLSRTETSETGVKRITVTVRRNGKELAELTAVRTFAADRRGSD